MGQYYCLVNTAKKEVINPRYGYKALETFWNDSNFYGQSLLILYQDLSCVEQGGGDIPYSTLLTKKELSLVGSWVNTPFLFVGDYTTSDVYTNAQGYTDITKELMIIIEKIKNKCYSHME